MDLKYGDLCLNCYVSKEYKEKYYFFNGELLKNNSIVYGKCPKCKTFKHFEIFIIDNKYYFLSNCCNILWEFNENVKYYIKFSNITEEIVTNRKYYNLENPFRFRIDPVNVGSKISKRKYPFSFFYNISISYYKKYFDIQILNDDEEYIIKDNRIISKYKIGKYNWNGDFMGSRNSKTWKNKKIKKQWMKNWR